MNEQHFPKKFEKPCWSAVKSFCFWEMDFIHSLTASKLLSQRYLENKVHVGQQLVASQTLIWVSSLRRLLW